MMNAEAADKGSTSLGQRIQTYEHRLGQVRAVASGLATFLILIVGDVMSTQLSASPHWFRAVLLSLLVVAGLCVAQSWVGYHWALTEIRLFMEESDLESNDSLPDALIEKRRAPRNWFYAALGLIATIAVLFLAGVWWPYLASVVTCLTSK